MPTYADLEITLRRRDEESYAIDLSFTQPEDEADIRPLAQPPSVKLDVKALRQHHLNDEDYGQTLTAQLFGEASVREAFNKARAAAQSQNVPLRVRLLVDGSAIELHGLRWETLRDPDDPASMLFTSQQLYFSRYLKSADWRPIRPRAKRELKALVVIANPVDLDPVQLAPVDVEGELVRATTALGQINTTVLARVADPGQFTNAEFAGQATLNEVQARLGDCYDILYLVCHGALEEGNPLLWLEAAAGQAHVVPGQTLVTRLKELAQPPRLVVLASCLSAGRGNQRRSEDQVALAALGPRLAEAGVPAVLAMQGKISQTTVEQFMPLFFETLQEEGQIDRAMAVARGQVRERSDWWMPVLFMRLKSGRLWYTPGFAGPAGFKKLPSLVNSIQRK